MAIIPDILLPTAKDLNVWAFVGTAENGYTKISKTFKVNRRNKPADYVFTTVEQTTINQLKSDLANLENLLIQIQDKLNQGTVVDHITVNEINDMIVAYFENKTVSEVEG